LAQQLFVKRLQNDPCTIAAAISLIAVESLAHKAAARELVREYLRWVADVARTNYGLIFDIDAMIESDIQDPSKFYPPTGRFYLLEYAGRCVGVGSLKRLAKGICEIQRMFVQPPVRGIGAGRALVEQLIQDAQNLSYLTVRLESLKALSAAHALYRSVGFVEIDPYGENSMKAYACAQTGADQKKQDLFCRQYLVDLNATQTAIRGRCSAVHTANCLVTS
jgi:GNAT superfamily N-acetyltransferase